WPIPSTAARARRQPEDCSIASPSGRTSSGCCCPSARVCCCSRRAREANTVLNTTKAETSHQSLLSCGVFVRQLPARRRGRLLRVPVSRPECRATRWLRPCCVRSPSGLRLRLEAASPCFGLLRSLPEVRRRCGVSGLPCGLFLPLSCKDGPRQVHRLLYLDYSMIRSIRVTFLGTHDHGGRSAGGVKCHR